MYSRNYGASPGSNLPPNYHGSVFVKEETPHCEQETAQCPKPEESKKEIPCACAVQPPCKKENKSFLSDDLILYGLIFLMLTGAVDFKQNEHLLLMAVLAYIVLF